MPYYSIAVGVGLPACVSRTGRLVPPILGPSRPLPEERAETRLSGPIVG